MQKQQAIFKPKEEELKEAYQKLRDSIPELLKKQAELQKKLMGEEWQQQFNSRETIGLPIVALLSEIGELVDSMGFKWWTKQERNDKNALIELADILHFWLLNILVHNAEDIAKNLTNPVESVFHLERVIWDEVIRLTESSLRPPIRDSINSFLIAICSITLWLGYSVDDLLKIYHEKNKLNKKRKDKGYDQDPSKKYENGKEDNEKLITEVETSESKPKRRRKKKEG